MRSKMLYSAGMLFLAYSAMSEVKPLPNPTPVFGGDASQKSRLPLFSSEQIGHSTWNNETKKQEPPVVYTVPGYTIGQKTVYISKPNGPNRPMKRQVSVYIFGKQHIQINFPWLKDDKNEMLNVDTKTGVTNYTCNYTAPNKQKAVFKYSLKSQPDGKVLLSWNTGIPQEQFSAENLKFEVDVYIANPRTTPFFVGGKKWIPTEREVVLKRQKHTPISGTLELYPDKPSKHVEISCDNMKGTLIELLFAGKYGDSAYTYYKVIFPKTEGSLTFDLKQGASVKSKTPPTGGIDFWKHDATHVPLSPTRNLFPNPSFEQGMRFWKWRFGGARFTHSPVLKHESIPQGLFGKNALIIRKLQPEASGLQSFPISLEPGKYVLSFYAKAEKPCSMTAAISNAGLGGNLNRKYCGDNFNPEHKFQITTEWKRYHRTFEIKDKCGFCLHLNAFNSGSDTLVDGIQLEKGTVPSEFTCAPIEGFFTTNAPDNDIVKGKPVGAGFLFSGKAGTKARVGISIRNAYRELLFRDEKNIEIGKDGTARLALSLPEPFEEGIFAVRADFHVNDLPEYTEYYRFSVMPPLSNTHATKDIFGTTNQIHTVPRGDAVAKKMMEWGFGSTSWWGPNVKNYTDDSWMLMKKYRIKNWHSPVFGWTNYTKGYREKENRLWTEITPEREKFIESEAYRYAKAADPERIPYWAFSNEEESSVLVSNGEFDEYFKAQSAVARGVKRANQKYGITPTSGTSGYSKMRGFDAYEGYLKAAQKHGFKYDAISVHPYGSGDLGILSSSDFDENTALLIAQMKRYGYGKETPILFTEGGCYACEVNIPEWTTNNYDSYCAGKPTYDFGNREFIQAATHARYYIICLKYYPQVKHANIWTNRPFIDWYLSPILLAKAVNTLGNLMPDVAYYADARPVPGVRGYVFKLKDGSAIAAIWCVDHEVENGLSSGPALDVKFGQNVTFHDFMGVPRTATPDRSGMTKVQLTPAPLYIKAKNVELLAKALQNAETGSVASALSVEFMPDENGTVCSIVKNKVGREQKGVLKLDDKVLNFEVAPAKETRFAMDKTSSSFGKIIRWNRKYTIENSKGDSISGEWNMDYFYVPECGNVPEWNKIPSISLENKLLYSKGGVELQPSHPEFAERLAAWPKIKADYKMAWNRENLFLRVEVQGKKLEPEPILWKKGNISQALYSFDGSLEVYLDCGANGRSNLIKRFDNDDYRYDFAPPANAKNGRGNVWRLREVNIQLADGTNSATKEEASRKIKCDFTRTPNGFIYTVTFPKRYLSPIVLRKGYVSGFAICLRDKDRPEGEIRRAFSNSTETGIPCDGKPQLWPLMILK